jgi:hypothetical protein
MQARCVGFPTFTAMSSILALHSTRCSRLVPRCVAELAAIAPLPENGTSANGTALSGSYARSPRVLGANRFQSTSVKRDLGIRLMSLTSRVLRRGRCNVILRL